MPITSGGISPAVTRAKTSSESVTSSVTLQDDNELVFPVNANEIWLVTYYLRVEFSAASQIKVAVNGPTANFVSVTAALTPNAIVPAYGTADAIATGISLVSALATGGLVQMCVGYAASQSGNLTLQWAQNTSDLGATTVKAGSYLVAYKI